MKVLKAFQSSSGQGDVQDTAEMRGPCKYPAPSSLLYTRNLSHTQEPLLKNTTMPKELLPAPGAVTNYFQPNFTMVRSLPAA